MSSSIEEKRRARLASKGDASASMELKVQKIVDEKYDQSLKNYIPENYAGIIDEIESKGYRSLISLYKACTNKDNSNSLDSILESIDSKVQREEVKILLEKCFTEISAFKKTVEKEEVSRNLKILAIAVILIISLFVWMGSGCSCSKWEVHDLQSQFGISYDEAYDMCCELKEADKRTQERLGW